MTTPMRPHTLALAIALATPLADSSNASSALWYATGHRLVARIAARRLTSHTAEAVRELLGGEDIAQASVWADQIRTERRETEPLHYVNIPLAASDYVPARDCPTGRCLIAAIEQDRNVLADSAASFAERADALRFLIHFMADLHQPLHVSDNGDRGGNERRVTFLGKPANLHAIWDGELIQATGLDERRYEDRLLRRMDSLNLAAMERGSVADWALEGHRIAVSDAYRIPPSGRIGNGYLEANLPAVDRALIKAGVRLAKVLNEALQTYRPGSSAAPASTPRVYSAREAAAHVGEVATVVGLVVSVHRSRSGNVFLNFGADYPHQSFTGAVLHPQDTRLLNLDSLVGKRVGVRGLIRRYRGQAEIVIASAEQIEVRSEE